MKIRLLVAILTAIAYLLPAICEAQAPTQAQLDAIEKILAPQRQKVLAVLEADKTGQYARYKLDVEAIAKQADRKMQQAMLEKLETDHLSFIRKAYADAKINNAQLKVEVAKVLGKIKFSFDDFGGIQFDIIDPNAVFPTMFDQSLGCPFEALDESCTSTLADVCFVNAAGCGIEVVTQAEGAGGGRAKADVGGKFELPNASNFSSITVSSQSNISYEGIVVGVGVYTQVNAKFGIRFRMDNGLDKTVITKEVIALAPIIWYNSVKGNVENYLAQTTISGNFQGGSTITAQTHAEVFAISVLSFPLTVISARVREIHFVRVKGSN